MVCLLEFLPYMIIAGILGFLFAAYQNDDL